MHIGDADRCVGVAIICYIDPCDVDFMDAVSMSTEQLRAVRLKVAKVAFKSELLASVVFDVVLFQSQKRILFNRAKRALPKDIWWSICVAK